MGLLDRFLRRRRFPPEGSDFLKLVSQQEDACEARTASALPRLGKLAPACYRNLGTVLSLLDRAASCYWGCRGGDHVVEYIAGRSCSSARAARRLFEFGYYDESLSINRSIGEIANLLLLFNFDPPRRRRLPGAGTLIPAFRSTCRTRSVVTQNSRPISSTITSTPSRHLSAISLWRRRAHSDSLAAHRRARCRAETGNLASDRRSMLAAQRGKPGAARVLRRGDRLGGPCPARRCPGSRLPAEARRLHRARPVRRLLAPGTGRHPQPSPTLRLTSSRSPRRP